MPRATRRLIKKISVKEKTSPKGDFNEVTTGVELHDPLRASELLAKDLGMLKERHEMTGADGGPIQFSDTELASRLQYLLTLAVEKG